MGTVQRVEIADPRYKIAKQDNRDADPKERQRAKVDFNQCPDFAMQPSQQGLPIQATTDIYRLCCGFLNFHACRAMIKDLLVGRLFRSFRPVVPEHSDLKRGAHHGEEKSTREHGQIFH
jgi:hypothetical protein